MPNSENSRKTPMAKHMALLTWLAVFAVFYLFFEQQILQRINPNQSPTSIQQNGVVEVQLKRNAAGHYVTNGRINQQQVVFLLDTGATNVSVPGHLAEQLGLAAGRPQMVSTANGNRTVYQSRINTLNIGDITLYNVAANINPGMKSNQILLGMSALKQLDFNQQDGWLYLTQTR